MRLTILGCGSAIPREHSRQTSQLLNIDESLFLIDCGEGTQVQLRKYKLKFSRINNIFISHLHGDHFFGLIGLISTFHLLGREKTLNIYSPKGLKEIIDVQLKHSKTPLNYKLNIFEIEDTTKSQKIFDDGKVEVITIPLNHRVNTNGYLFKEKLKDRVIDRDIIKKYNIPISQIEGIKKGKDFIKKNGEIISNDKVSYPPKKSISYAFCSDTNFKEDIVDIIKNVNILYHESTFLESERYLAEKTLHSTAKQAGTIAKKANAGRLILGHFSQRYKDYNLFKEEAKKIFNNTELAKDGKTFIF